MGISIFENIIKTGKKYNLGLTKSWMFSQTHCPPGNMNPFCKYVGTEIWFES